MEITVTYSLMVFTLLKFDLTYSKDGIGLSVRWDAPMSLLGPLHIAREAEVEEGQVSWNTGFNGFCLVVTVVQLSCALFWYCTVCV